MEIISRGGMTAQIDPLRFCQWLLAQCKKRGIRMHYPARALSVLKDGEGIMNGIRIRQDGVETERKTATSYYTASLTSHSTMYTPRSYSGRMVTACLQHSLPQLPGTNTCLCARWPLSARAKPTFQARQRRRRALPCCLRNRHARLFARVLCADGRRVVSGGPEQHNNSSARCSDRSEAQQAGNRSVESMCQGHDGRCTWERV
jgi:hypothetical protein